MIELKQKEERFLANISWLHYKKIKWINRILPLSSFANEIICGTTPSTKNHSFWVGKTPFITVDAMSKQIFVTKTERYISAEAYSKSKRNVHAGFLMVSCIGTVGVVSFASCDSQTNQQINTIDPIKKYKYFLYWALKSKKQEFLLLSKSGSATPNINKDTFSKIRFNVPDNESLQEFNEISSPIFSTILNLQHEIDALRVQRKALLQKYFGSC